MEDLDGRREKEWTYPDEHDQPEFFPGLYEHERSELDDRTANRPCQLCDPPCARPEVPIPLLTTEEERDVDTKLGRLT